MFRYGNVTKLLIYLRFPRRVEHVKAEAASRRLLMRLNSK